MRIIVIMAVLQAVAIAVMLYGIRHNEKVRRRRYHHTPGGKAILVAYGLFIVEFCLMVFRCFAVSVLSA